MEVQVLGFSYLEYLDGSTALVRRRRMGMGAAAPPHGAPRAHAVAAPLHRRSSITWPLRRLGALWCAHRVVLCSGACVDQAREARKWRLFQEGL